MSEPLNSVPVPESSQRLCKRECVCIKLYLQNQSVGQIWPSGHGLPTLALDPKEENKHASPLGASL